jgi:hypothetical protein
MDPGDTRDAAAHPNDDDGAASREDTWAVFFHVLTTWQKAPSTLRLFQEVEETYGREWMADVVFPKQQELLRMMYLWTDQPWEEVYAEMVEKAAIYRPLPVAVTRMKEQLTVGPGDVMPTFPVVDLMRPGQPRTSIQELVRGSRLAVVVAGSLT